MNSKLFVDLVCKAHYHDKMSLFDTIVAIKNDYDIHLEDIVGFLKEEKTLMKDLQSECILKKLVISNKKSFDLESLF